MSNYLGGFLEIFIKIIMKMIGPRDWEDQIVWDQIMINGKTKSLIFIKN